MNAPSASDWILPNANLPQGVPKIAVLGGDGIGPDVMDAAVRCIEATGVQFEYLKPEHGDAAAAAGNDPFSDATREAIEAADAILFGAIRENSKKILRYIRFFMDAYANVRPAASVAGIPAITGEGRTNMVIVRELTEEMYPAREGDLSDFHTRWPDLTDALGRSLPHEGRFAVRVVTEEATRRIARYAIKLALHRKQLGRGKGHVTVVHKKNVLSHTDGLFYETCVEELRETPELTYDDLMVDEAARRCVARPFDFDVVVTSNQYGDIISDVAVEAMGGMPVAPSAGFGEKVAYFEPCHGSAPDIAGQNIANPSATILSAAMLLAYLGYRAESDAIVGASVLAIADGERTRDLGGSLTTTEFTEAVIARLK